MQLEAIGAGESPLFVAWRDAIAPMRLRHPNRTSVVRLRLIDAATPLLVFSLDKTTDTTAPDRELCNFQISTVTLTYFPGVALAQAWVAAAWVGYLQHEALELVTVGDLVTRPLDPHAEGNDYDRGLRTGLPIVLTPATLYEALVAVMPRRVAQRLVGA
jgi:hypothetical protein